MNFLNTCAALLMLTLLPIVAGMGFIVPFKSLGGEEKKRIFFDIIWSWFFGQLLLWCIFQPIAVRLVLKSERIQALRKEYLVGVGIVVLVSVVLCVVGMILNKKRGEDALYKGWRINSESEGTLASSEKPAQVVDIGGRNEKMLRVIAIVVVALIVIQAFLQVFLAYMEVDDAFYVTEAVSSAAGVPFYERIPYTGAYTGGDFRHGLAPFPLWLAFISVFTGLNATSLSHVVLPPVHLLLTYGEFALIGRTILGKNKKYLPVFMLLICFLNLFGFTSYMTPEKFFMTRIREGKATIASMILPGLILALFLILKSLGENKKIDFRLYILLFTLNVSGCLCSTLGALLCAVPVFICAVLGAIMFKKIRHFLPMAISCVPCAVFAFMYLKL
ncbi:MAG: hypothetical protein IJ195_05620 [Lachnospiraceae bacterium]|nr:hypothetical protein [Lachnospiraceae bacterium]